MIGYQTADLLIWDALGYHHIGLGSSGLYDRKDMQHGNTLHSS